MSRAARLLVEKHFISLLDFIFSLKETSNGFDIANLDAILVSNDTFQLAIYTLMLFCNNYPLDIRNYFENCEKKYIKQAESLMKTYIGPHLFQQEVD